MLLNKKSRNQILIFSYGKILSNIILKYSFKTAGWSSASGYSGPQIRGADFRELPNQRIIRRKWVFINFIVCVILALAIVSPILPYAVKLLLEAIDVGSIPIPEAYLYAALPINGAIASIITYLFYRIAVKNAEELLIKAEG